MTKVTMEGYIEELETEIAKLGLVDESTFSGYDKYLHDQDLMGLEMRLDCLNFDMEDQSQRIIDECTESQEMLLACRNCQKPEMCDCCAYGGNMPPMGV